MPDAAAAPFDAPAVSANGPVSVLAQLSTAALRAELAGRQEEDGEYRPACGSGAKGRGSYNTELHIGAVFIILFLSVLACSFPIAVRRFPSLPIPHRFLFLSRHFGTGVLIATAFVHLLPTAFVSLTDPCLPPFWNDGYPAMAGLVAMSAVLVVVAVEQFFASKGAGHAHDYSALGTDGDAEAGVRLLQYENGGLDGFKAGPGTPRRSISAKRFRQSSIGTIDSSTETVNVPLTTNRGRPSPHRRSSSFTGYKNFGTRPHDADSDADLELDEFRSTNALKQYPKPDGGPHQLTHESNGVAGGGNLLPPPEVEADRAAANGTPHSGLTTPPPPYPGAHGHGHSDEASEQKEVLQIMLLEAGILFHSVFIGMALSVAVGTPFIVLLVAISFHQTFEGLALGTRIAAIAAFNHPPARAAANAHKPWLMALAYGTTTPLGQLLGLLVHGLYDPASETGLLMVGVTNAVSSGLLLFAGLVELLAEDFLSDKSYVELRGGRRLQACAAVVLGAACMAIVGAWA